MNMLRNKVAIPLVDAGLAAIFALMSVFLRIYTHVGARRLRLSTKVFKNIGVFPIADHYYQPLFNDSHLFMPLSKDRDLPGINLNESGQLELLKKLKYSNELVEMRLNFEKQNPNAFYIKNGGFESGDAEFLYQFIRHIKPRTIIEIGSGNSTIIANAAVERNLDEFGYKTKHICIEPYEQPWLEEIGVEVIRERAEKCQLNTFANLKSGDLLFIDSSHMIRPQGDVLFEYLYLLPTLNSGVYIHVHDIFTPKDYPDEWIRKDVLFWNEQYLLEALLTNSNRYKVIASLNYLKHKHYQTLFEVCPYLTPINEPGSFYLQVI